MTEYSRQKRVEPDDIRYHVSSPDGGGTCLSYFITGNVGNCIMLPVWRAVGRFLKNGFGISTIVAVAIIALIVLRKQS